MTLSEREERDHAIALGLLPDDERRRVIPGGVGNLDEEGRERVVMEATRWHSPKRQ